MLKFMFYLAFYVCLQLHMNTVKVFLLIRRGLQSFWNNPEPIAARIISVRVLYFIY